MTPSLILLLLFSHQSTLNIAVVLNEERLYVCLMPWIIHFLTAHSVSLRWLLLSQCKKQICDKNKTANWSTLSLSDTNSCLFSQSLLFYQLFFFTLHSARSTSPTSPAPTPTEADMPSFTQDHNITPPASHRLWLYSLPRSHSHRLNWNTVVPPLWQFLHGLMFMCPCMWSCSHPVFTSQEHTARWRHSAALV